MAELRYNPISKDWVMVASHRQNRPQMPKDWCPFCPGPDNAKVPSEGYEVLRYMNDFPALQQAPPEPDDVETGLFKTAPAYGRCEVVLYSDQHRAQLKDLPDAHVHKLAHLWQDCFCDMKRDPKLEYCFIFENRGDVVGVTMPHPHGQVYGYPFVPQKIRDESANARDYYDETGRCLFCDCLKDELEDGRRIIFQNESFVVYVPFFSPITYGVHITARRHLGDLSQMTDGELEQLGETVRDVAGMYDSLFDRPFPYMMCMHNAPLNGGQDSYHFHIEFFPPMRSAEKQQFFASSETGAGAWCNPTRPEEKAAELQAAYRKFKGMD
ncbi:MAG: galactose-1-phosphate uridylyltransferase [Oscillospiraceae bacterium]|jgi:UDPglucose--hexose-1-phosphate uridylyltransferase|nr:galactose-1-phosphate uridylyltransferase [Oscillospiraceae bacterium]